MREIGRMEDHFIVCGAGRTGRQVVGAIRMASVLLRPSVVSFLDIATRSSKLALRMEQASIDPEAGTEFLFNPVASTRLEPGDEMIVLGKKEQIALLKEYANE